MDHYYAVILAGGDGTRLRSLTRAITGDERPKQFAPVIGGQTLLDQTRNRVALSISQENTLLVVTKRHEQFYQSLPKHLRLLVQPENKGTAPGIIFGFVVLLIGSLMIVFDLVTVSAAAATV